MPSLLLSLLTLVAAERKRKSKEWKCNNSLLAGRLAQEFWSICCIFETMWCVCVFFVVLLLLLYPIASPSNVCTDAARF